MIRLAPEGTMQMAASTFVLGGAIWASVVWFWPAVVPLVGVWIWSIAFFRDPPRACTSQPGEFVSPADGTISDITEYEHHDLVDGPAIRIGMFLSLFNVHINRSPCDATVRTVIYQKGKFHAAMKPRAAEENESKTLVMDVGSPLNATIVVRQIAGMAARRIVCHAKAGTTLQAGERFGLIKYGSRTELTIPKRDGTKVLVGIGHKVQAGLTVLASMTTAADHSTHASEPNNADMECSAN
jgi:phosphatidylserine decarboxylase